MVLIMMMIMMRWRKGVKMAWSPYKVHKTRDAGPYIQARRDNPPLYLQGHKQFLLEIFYFNSIYFTQKRVFPNRNIL